MNLESAQFQAPFVVGVLPAEARLRFEVRNPQGGQSHEVTLQGTVAVIGRDPACELVVSDPKCSRRHAVLEAGPQGITIRDAGSANGVFVNDRKVERSPLKEGDLVRLGDVVLKVLPEEMPGTLMMGPEDMDARRPAAGARATRRGRRHSAPDCRAVVPRHPPHRRDRRPGPRLRPRPRGHGRARRRPPARRARSPSPSSPCCGCSASRSTASGRPRARARLGWSGVWAALPVAWAWC